MHNNRIMFESIYIIQDGISRKRNKTKLFSHAQASDVFFISPENVRWLFGKNKQLVIWMEADEYLTFKDCHATNT